MSYVGKYESGKKSHRSHLRNRKKIEFSKIMLVYAAIVNTIVIGVTIYIVLKTYDTQPLITLIPAVATEVSVGTGFYYNKAKIENRIKLMVANGINPSEQSFKDSIY